MPLEFLLGNLLQNISHAHLQAAMLSLGVNSDLQIFTIYKRKMNNKGNSDSKLILFLNL